MAKEKEDREGKGKPSGSECNLDGDYLSPVKSFRDLTLNTVKNAIVYGRYVQILIFLTITGFFLRFYHLGYNSLWLDEAFTYTFSVKSLSDIWWATTTWEFNPPLFYWIEHIMLIFGNNEVVLRFIPALLGVLTIPFIYLVGREYIDRNVGIIAAAAFAFSPFLIYYSQEARAYSTMLFFLTVAAYFYLKALKDNDIKNWVIFSVFSALAFWTHFYALVLIGGFFLYALYDRFSKRSASIKSGLKPVFIAAIALGIICLPLIIAAIKLFFIRSASAPTYGGIQGPGLISASFAQISGSEIAIYVLFLLFIIGIAQAFVMDKNKGIFLVSITILTFLISTYLSFKFTMQPRYLIFLTIIFFLGVATSYKMVYSFLKTPWVIYGFIGLLCILSAPGIMDYYSGYAKEDWRSFSGRLEQLTQPGDFVIVVPGYVSRPLNYYYSNSSDSTLEFGATGALDLNAINQQKKNNTEFFVVTRDISVANPNGDAVQWLNEHTKLLSSDSRIYLFTSV